jgi:hypothetical protein
MNDPADIITQLRDSLVGDLKPTAEHIAKAATPFLQQAHDDAVTAVVCQKLADDYADADPEAKVRDVVPAEVVKQAFADAEKKVSELLRNTAAKQAMNS